MPRERNPMKKAKDAIIGVVGSCGLLVALVDEAAEPAAPQDGALTVLGRRVGRIGAGRA